MKARLIVAKKLYGNGCASFNDGKRLFTANTFSEEPQISAMNLNI